MIQEQGVVVCTTVTGAIVETRRTSSCGACRAAQSCGTEVLQRVLGKRQPTRVTALALFPVNPGDRVIVGLNDGALLRCAAMLYGLPLVGLFSGAFVTSWIQGLYGGVADWPVVTGAALGLAAALGGARRLSRRLATDSRFQSYIISKAGDPATSPVLLDGQTMHRGG